MTLHLDAAPHDADGVKMYWYKGPGYCNEVEVEVTMQCIQHA